LAGVAFALALSFRELAGLLGFLPVFFLARPLLALVIAALRYAC
jgi:hypothetical protein